ncbi:MAG: DUF1622 domain-containing protein [Pseudomonadota bacterium]
MSEGATATDLLIRSSRAIEEDFPTFFEVLHWLADVISLVAIIVMVLGTIRFVLRFLPGEVLGNADERAARIDGARVELGRYILAGLEVLIVADIIHTALSLAFGDLLFLGLLVAIRIAISYFLDREIEGLRKDGRA